MLRRFRYRVLLVLTLLAACLRGLVAAQTPSPSGSFTTSTPYIGSGRAIPVGFAPPGSRAVGSFPSDLWIDAPEWLRELLGRMWRTSPTFRRQCARLVEVRAEIEVTLVTREDLRGARAITKMRVGEQLNVHVLLAQIDPLRVAHLAHEIEHVLERIDGVDLPFAALNGVRGVSRVVDGASVAFETVRAAAVGQQVAHETGEPWR
jgi:hypothetical protein